MEKTIFLNSQVDISNELNITIDIINGYKVINPLKGGGEGDIYRVVKDEHNYILKLYRYGIEPPFSSINKIKDISRENNENLVEIYETGYDSESRRYYEVMEEIKFGNMSEVKDVVLKNVKSFIKQLIDALELLNQKKLLHLDLKPSNILIRSLEPFDVVLSDFGMVTDTSLLKSTKDIKGTETYWAPEASLGNTTEKSDYWSLGIVLYELLLGMHPYRKMDEINRKLLLNFQEIPIEEDELSYEETMLLKGLLTKDPLKRWGFNEVNKWLKGNISKVYNNYTVPTDLSNHFIYKGNSYSSIDNFYENEALPLVKDAIDNGHIKNWYLANDYLDLALKMEDLLKHGNGFYKVASKNKILFSRLSFFQKLKAYFA